MPTETEKPTVTEADLSHFYGSENWYRHQLGGGKLLYTDGIKFLADNAGAYWLIDVVFSHVLTNAKLRREEFILCRLESDGKRGAIFTAKRDTDEPNLARQEIDFTDFPPALLPFEFYCEANELGGHTMLLKTEH